MKCGGMGEQINNSCIRSTIIMNREEKWKEFIEKYSDNILVSDPEFGTVALSRDAMKDVHNGENLTYEEYLQAIFNSLDDRRESFENCYYAKKYCGGNKCNFKGQISGFDKKSGKVIFNSIYISTGLKGDDYYDGNEEFVWMDVSPFENYQVGDCLAFEGEIYRYLETSNGNRILFGVRDLCGISKIEECKLPNEDDLLMQDVDEMLCQVCEFSEQCHAGTCVINKELREEMKKFLFEDISTTIK